MKRCVELTSYCESAEVFVNPNFICAIEACTVTDAGCYVYTTNSVHTVMETPKEVLDLIEKAEETL